MNKKRTQHWGKGRRMEHMEEGTGAKEEEVEKKEWGGIRDNEGARRK